MSVAGLRFQRYSGSTTAPQKTRSGSYIYSGDPASFHDWEFRTRMRLRLCEDAVKAKARKTSKSGSEVEAPSDSGEEPTSGAEQPWQRRTVKKEAERLPDDVHFVGQQDCQHLEGKGWASLLVGNLANGPPWTSPNWGRARTGTCMALTLSESSNSPPNEAHWCACFPRLTAQMLQTQTVRIRLIEQGSRPLLMASTAVLQERVQRKDSPARNLYSRPLLS